MPTGCLHKTAGSPQDLYIIHNTECIAGQRRKPNSHGAKDELSHRQPLHHVNTQAKMVMIKGEGSGRGEGGRREARGPGEERGGGGGRLY